MALEIVNKKMKKFWQKNFCYGKMNFFSPLPAEFANSAYRLVLRKTDRKQFHSFGAKI